MGNPFKKSTGAVTSKGNPFRRSTSDTAIEDSALSPLLEERPFDIARPSLPATPLASKPLPTITTTAPAPKEFEKRLTRAIREGTKKAAPFGSEEELTPEQAIQLERARYGRAAAEDIGKAAVGQPSRSILRMATGIANIRNDPRAEALAASLRKVEEETAPETAIGAVARGAAEIGAFIPSGVLTGAARSFLESAAGKEFSTVGRNIENPLLRGLSDAALDLSIPGALAARRGYKTLKDIGETAGDAFTAGLREGAGEAAEAATPSLARKDMYAPRTAPEASPTRMLPREASATIPSYAIPQIGEPTRVLGPAIPMRAPAPSISGPASPLMPLLPARAGTMPAPVTGQMQGPAIPTTPGVPLPSGPASTLMRLLPSRTGQAQPATTGALQGPAIPMPAGIVRPEGPASPIMRLLTAQSEALRQRLFQMPPLVGPELPEGDLISNWREIARSKASPRIAGEEAARRLASTVRPSDRATPEEIKRYLSGKPLESEAGTVVRGTPASKAIFAAEQEIANQFLKREAFPPSAMRQALERAGRLLRGEGAGGPDISPLPESVLEQASREVAGEIPRPRGGEAPEFLAGVPIDELTRELDLISASAQGGAKKAGPVSKLSDPELEAELVRRSARAAELEAEILQFDERMVDVLDQFKGKQRSPYLTSSMRAANTRAKQVRNPVTGELMETAAERRARERGISDEDLGRLEEAGFADRDEYLAMRADINKKRLALSAMRKAEYVAQKEYVRRTNKAIASGQMEGQLLPEPVNPSKPRAEKGTGRTAEQSILDAENAAQMEALRSQQRLSGIAAPGVIGAGVGGVTGEEDSDMTPLQRALLMGAAGAVGGGLALRRFRAGREVVTPSIPELAPIAETINIGKRAAKKEAPSILGMFGRAYNQIFSETYVMEQAAKRFGTAEQAKVLPEIVAQQQGSRRAAEGYLQDTLTPLISKLSKAEKDNVRSLLKARRELQILQQGGVAKSETPRDVLERAVAAGNADQKIAGVADQITKMHRDLLDMRYQAGLLTEEAYNAIKASDDFYTPFFREVAEDKTLAGMLPDRTGGFNIVGSGVQRMDRTAQALEKTADPLETIVVDAARTYRDVARQRVSNVIFNIADAGTLPFLKRINADPANPPKGEGIIQQMRNGKLFTYKVTDKDLFNALAGQDAVASNIAVKIAQAMKGIKTAGITILPDFATANVIRDVALSGIQRPDTKRAIGEAALGAGVGGGLRVFQEDGEDPVKNFLVGAGLGAGAGLYARPFLETMSAVKSITLPRGVTVLGKQLVKPDDIFRQFLADGGSTEGFFVRNADDAARILKRLEKEPGFSVQDIVNPKNWWETLQKVGSIAEQATRVAAYRQLKEAGATGAEAALAAQDRTLRFAKVGGSKAVKGLASVTPFWNAKLQGWDKLGRLLKEPKTWGLGAGMLTAPSLALWSINKDNPEYWDRPIYERNLFWLVPKSLVGEEGEKGFYRIPKPFEIGYMFASIPERMLDYFAQAGVDLPVLGQIQNASPEMGEPGQAFGRATKEMAESTFEGTLPYPEIVSLPTQLAMNRDFFRDRPIVTRPQLSPELQVTEETSAIARALAKAGVSPEKTDFAIRNIFGTAGGEASKLVDIAARATGLPAPETGTAGIPLVGRFGERFSTSNKGQTDPEALARERLRELNQVEVDYRELKRRAESGSPAAYDALVNFAMENEADLDLAKQIQPIETELEKLSRKRTEIRKDPRYSPEERRIALEILRERGQELSAMLIGVRQP